MEEQILIKKDNLGKLRVVVVGYKEVDSPFGIYQIYRHTGQHDGQMTEQPTIDVLEGKAGRSTLEQVQLEYKSILSDYTDKGYKPLEKYGCKELNDLTAGVINDILSETVTDANGVQKPMLAKTAFPKDDPRWNQTWLASFKIDGVRCTIFKDKDGNLRSASRGGKDYDTSIAHILNDPEIKYLFEHYPNLALDGELYIHGKPLSYISGLCRANVNTSDAQKEIRFYVFDIVDPVMIFEKRLELLSKVRDVYDFGNLENQLLVFVDHFPVYSYESAMDFHTIAIAEGYEGLVLRDPKKKYGFGTRDWRMIKVKVFEDAEFKIVGAVEGLRPEDMVFVMQMDNGLTFEAKPIGDRALREWYLENIKSLIGKFGTVKYFGFGANGRPNLPVFKCLRDY